MAVAQVLQRQIFAEATVPKGWIVHFPQVMHAYPLRFSPADGRSKELHQMDPHDLQWKAPLS